jgi:hypothetical protein
MLGAARDAAEIASGRDKVAWNQDRVVRLALERSVGIVGDARDRCGASSLRYRFETEDFRKAIQRGFVCYPAFSKCEGDYTDGGMEAFMNRLPPRSRLVRALGDYRSWDSALPQHPSPSITSAELCQFG